MILSMAVIVQTIVNSALVVADFGSLETICKVCASANASWVNIIFIDELI